MKIKPKVEKPKNDVIYIRVSSKEQVENFSLDNQEKFCREFSKRSEHIVLKVFREEGESAKTEHRTRFQEMLRFCDKNKKQIDRVVIYKVDRFFRNAGEHLAFRSFLKKLNISLVSVTEAFDDSPSGKLQETMLAAFAQFDNDVRSQRTAEGLKARALKGLWSGKSPWGYVNTKDKLGNKIIIPHPERAPVVKMIFEKHITGKYSCKELAGFANKCGQRSRHGMKITKQLVAKILKNPIYCGRIVIQKFGVDIEGSHIAIISTKLFDEASSNKRGVAGRKLARNRDSPDYPLRGIKCAGCGKSISGGKTKGKTKYYQYYGCFCGDCPKRTAIPKKDMEEEFTKFLTKMTPDDKHFDVLKEAIKLAHKNELNSVVTSENKINIKIAEIKDKKDKLLNLRLETKISDEDFLPANEKCKIELLQLQKDLSELSSPELEIDRVVDTGVEFLKHLPEIWEKIYVKDLRVLRTLLFPSNLYYHYPTIKTPELCCIYNIEPEFLDEVNRSVTLLGIAPRFEA